ncbi:hypothetical protein PtB15_8B777 [Puccinia triticina]|nr:hypothetical protein PtB15_8B777 [Puccinia triticina]
MHPASPYTLFQIASQVLFSMFWLIHKSGNYPPSSSSPTASRSPPFHHSSLPPQPTRPI